jgi:hypothetical protein
MQTPTFFRPTLTSIPPMYAWPPVAKRAVLTLSILAVVTAYILLAGGIVTALAVLAQGMGH